MTGYPVPAVHALNADNQVVMHVGGKGIDEIDAGGVDAAMDNGNSLLVEDTNVKNASMLIDTAVIAVIFCIESHRVFSVFGFALTA